MRQLPEYTVRDQAVDRFVRIAEHPAEHLARVGAELRCGRANAIGSVGQSPRNSRVNARADFGVVEPFQQPARLEVGILDQIARTHRRKGRNADRLELLGDGPSISSCRPIRDVLFQRVFVDSARFD